MRRNNVSLRLPPHLLARIKQLAEEEERSSVNQLLTVAVAEKIARLEADASYRAREGRSQPGAGWRVLKHMGQSSPPLPGDELPKT